MLFCRALTHNLPAVSPAPRAVPRNTRCSATSPLFSARSRAVVVCNTVVWGNTRELLPGERRLAVLSACAPSAVCPFADEMNVMIARPSTAARVHPLVRPNRSVTPLAMGCLDRGGDLVPYEQPTLVHVRSAARPPIPIILRENMTVDELVDELRRRLLLGPMQGISLSYNAVPLVHGRLADHHVGSPIQMTIFRQDADPARGLERVRITSEHLRTRFLEAQPSTTVGEIMERIEAAIKGGPHEWYDKQGEQLLCEGAIWLSNASIDENEGAGTSALRQGEELVAVVGGTSDKKKGTLAVRRAESGAPANILREHATPLEISKEEYNTVLLWNGLPLRDKPRVTLWELGVRTDDHLCLTFTSPVEPKNLQLVRAPLPEKKAKGGKKGKGGKGGKKKK